MGLVVTVGTAWPIIDVVLLLMEYWSTCTCPMCACE